MAFYITMKLPYYSIDDVVLFRCNRPKPPLVKRGFVFWAQKKTPKQGLFEHVFFVILEAPLPPIYCGME